MSHNPRGAHHDQIQHSACPRTAGQRQQHRSCEPADYEALDAAVSGHSAKGPARGCPAKAVYFEVLTNSLLQVNNVTKISEIAHRYGAFSSYLLLHPLVKSVHYPGLSGHEYEIWTLFRKLRMR